MVINLWVFVKSFDPGRAEGPAQTKLARSASEVWSREVAFRERAARAGFEIALKTPRLGFSDELDGNDEAPRSITGGVNVQSCVVPFQSFRHIAGQARVVPLGFTIAAEYVDKASR